MKNFAFTMAEILISLTIIGVIAAITLPALQANINEKTWATERKVLYSRMSQALSMLPSLNGYGVYEGTWADGDIVTTTSDTAAERFLTDGLSKVLQINNICSIQLGTSSENARKEFSKCGIPDRITTMPDMDTGKPVKISFPTNLTELNPMFTSTYSYVWQGNPGSYRNPQRHINTNAAAFETKNGKSIAVFYNPYCQPDMGETYEASVYSQPKMCANFVYDLNGKKGPNKVGKDIGFITALYPTDGEIVAPMPLEKNAGGGNQTLAAAACKAKDENSRMPNHYELMSMFYNRQLIGIKPTNYWSSTVTSTGKALRMAAAGGFLSALDRSGTHYYRCIKR